MLIPRYKNEMFHATWVLCKTFTKLVRHGFFNLNVRGETRNGRTQVFIDAGRIERFNIRENEIDEFESDFWDGSTDDEG